MKLTHPMFNSSGWKRRFRLKPYSSLENNHNTVSPGDSNSESASVIDDQLSTRGSSDKSVITTSSYTHSMAYTADSIKPVSNHFAYPDSPKADSLSVWSDAAGEPLINDSKSDVIPRSVRPLDLNSSRQHAEDDQFYSSYQDPILESADLDIPNNTTELPRTPDTVIRKSVLDSNGNHQHGKQSFDSIISSSGEYSPRNQSSFSSIVSTDTAPSSHGLAPLQARSLLDEAERLDPVLEDDPSSFELVAPPPRNSHGFSVEKRAEDLFSHSHLQEIFADPTSMLKFTQFLSNHRQDSIPLLIYYLDALKSLKAIKYANAIAEALSPITGLEFTEKTVEITGNTSLERRAQEAFNSLVNEELPAYISHVFIQVVNVSLHRRVTGTMPAHLREASEGLAEVFCLTDPSRADNPIVFASEEFHRTTQYGVDYSIGRNCRFLQGPNTSKDGVRRLSEAIKEGREVNEVFLNYRRDGSAFMNLLTVAPLIDHKGNIRYFIGAQVDVTGLCKDCTDLDSLKTLLDRKNGLRNREKGSSSKNGSEPKETDEFQELTEMFNDEEMEVVRKSGGRMHQLHYEETVTQTSHRTRLHVRDSSNESKEGHSTSLYNTFAKGKGSSLFQNYLLVRPYPSLRIIFASPAFRTPGMLQSPFLNRIGGSTRVRDELTAALASGRGVTAKVRWVPGRATDADGAPRWVHCTPLLGKSGSVGVWMVIVVDEDGYEPIRKFKEAPPVASDISKAAEYMSKSKSDEEMSKRASIILHHKIKGDGAIRASA